MPRIRKYLYVPYNERQEAKNLGALWDIKEKKFFVPYYLEQNLFEKWSKEKQERKFQAQKTSPSYQNIDTNEAMAQFKTALQAQGFIIDTPIMNGKIQRCRVEGDKGNEKSGAYLGHLDEYPAGFIQNHKTGYKANWKFELTKEYNANSVNSNTTTQQNHLNQNNINTLNTTLQHSLHSNTNLKKAYEEKHKERELELLSLQQKTALRLEKEYNESKEASPSHPYLLSKGLKQSYDLKVDRFNNLLIPLKDIKGKLWSLQRISENGSKIIGVIKNKEEKDIEYSARKKACFYTQLPLEKHKEFYLCEGFATAMSLQELLNKPVIMAVDAGNLKSVVEVLKANFPNQAITLFADNDLKATLQGRKNVGVESAKQIQENFPDIQIIIPSISKEEALNGMSDFNDVYLAKGMKELRKQINSHNFHSKFSTFTQKIQNSQNLKLAENSKNKDRDLDR